MPIIGKAQTSLFTSDSPQRMFLHRRVEPT
jgi:hypothetical protein